MYFRRYKKMLPAGTRHHNLIGHMMQYKTDSNPEMVSSPQGTVSLAKQIGARLTVYHYAAAFVALSLLVTTLVLEHHTNNHARVYLQAERQLVDSITRSATEKLNLYLTDLRHTLTVYVQTHFAELDQVHGLPVESPAYRRFRHSLKRFFPALREFHLGGEARTRPDDFASRDCRARYPSPPADTETVQVCFRIDSTAQALRVASRSMGADGRPRRLVLILETAQLLPYLQDSAAHFPGTDKSLLLINLAYQQIIDLSTAEERYPPGRRLSMSVRDEMVFSRPLTETTWQVSGLLDLKHYQDYVWGLWRSNLLIIVPLALSSVILLTFVRRESTTRAASEEAARLRSEQLELIMDNIPHPIFLKDGEGRWLQVNRYGLEVFGLQNHPYQGKKEAELAEFCGPAGAALEICRESDELAWQRRAPHQQEKRLPGADGEELILDILKIPRFDAIGRRKQLIVVALDITARKRWERVLAEEKERAQVTLEAITDGVIRTRADGTVEYLNPVAEKLTGWNLQEARERSVEEITPLYDENSGEPILHPVNLCTSISSTVYPSGNSMLRQRNSKFHPIQETAAPLRTPKGKINGVVLVLHDISTTRRLSQQLSYQASHDTLTGLFNRHAFEEQVMAALQDTQHQYVLCYLDLDQFKILNDTSGHLAGDELLRQIAMLLQQYIDAKDTVARLGGDEFGLLLAHCTLENALRVTEQIRDEIYNFRFMWQGKLFRLGSSIGVVPLRAGERFADALRAADSACYSAKELGRNRVHVYNPDDAKTTLRHAEMEWVAAIHDSIAHNRFELHRQTLMPLQNVSEGLHFEVLLRMRDTEGGLVSPGSFIAAAERYGLMKAIDRWVVHRCFEILSLQPDILGKLSLCSINLSGQTLNDMDFFNFVTQQFDDYPLVAPEKICFEITETAAVTEMREASEFIHKLKELGCRFALDDFGSGFSSFAYLKKLPVDYLKIDGSFVKDMVEDRIDAEMVKVVNQLGQVMGLKTVAEFVENEKIMEELRRYGVNYAQGYAVDMPVRLG